MASAAPWALPEWLHVLQDAGFQVISAHLVDKHLKENKVEDGGGGVRSLISTALTRFYWLRSLLTPGGRRARARYRALAQRHSDDGSYIEPRLFVLAKPFSQ